MDSPRFIPSYYMSQLPGQAQSNKLNTIIEIPSPQSSADLTPDRETDYQNVYDNLVRPLAADDNPSPLDRPPSGDLAARKVQDFFDRTLQAHTQSPPLDTGSPLSSLNSRRNTWTSSMNARSSTAGTDFEDLYGVSDDETGDTGKMIVDMEAQYDSPVSKGSPGTDEGDIPIVIVRRLQSLADSCRRPNRAGPAPASVRNRYPPILIPHVQSMQEGAKSSPVPPTPPPKIPISPAILSRFARDVPLSSAPPSLDGSQTSEQLANSTAPPTPDTAGSDINSADWGNGVQLSTEAMATLQILSGDGQAESDGEPEAVFEVPYIAEAPSQHPPMVSRDSDETVKEEPKTPAGMEVPSPTRFFSSLAPGTRQTWNPPSSSTAERFYNLPWTVPDADTEEAQTSTQSVSTIPPKSRRASCSARRNTLEMRATYTPLEVVDEIVRTDCDIDFDDAYKKGLKDVDDMTRGRLSLWLETQDSYLKSQKSVNPNSLGISSKQRNSSLRPPGMISALGKLGKKSVKFLEDGSYSETDDAVNQRKDPTFLNAFRFLLSKLDTKDGIYQSHSWFDAVQTSRITSSALHRKQLLGQYEPYNKAIVLDLEDTPTESQIEIARVEKERHALAQIQAAVWCLLSLKALHGGRLLTLPATRQLSRQNKHAKPQRTDRTRILDLGGESVCSWAWECAESHPMTKVYTVLTKDVRQTSYEVLQGPRNHRQVAVPHLWKLPFPDKYFEVISARTLHMLLKTDAPPGETRDEYDLCLLECMRCLRPGGYLEFMVHDSDMLQAGPLGSAASVEFGFRLQTRGYDPTPTRGWVGRLRRAGFTSVKRCWTFLPAGVPRAEAERSGELRGQNISGLVGSWAWERWMAKLAMEEGRGPEADMETVGKVVDEGRECGAGWRCMMGRARKPLR